MTISRTALICVACFIVYASCQEDSNPGDGNIAGAGSDSSTVFEEEPVSSVPTDASSISSEGETVSGKASGSMETSSLEVTSEITTDEDVGVLGNSTIDTSQDIHITGTSSPEEEEGSGNPTGETDDVSTSITPPGHEVRNRTVCSRNPCSNGGTCIEEDIDLSLYSCICPPGYVGTRCRTKDMCVEGHDGVLCENGECVYSSDGFERFCHCFRGTNWDEEMKECRVRNRTVCSWNPCRNGGTCIEDDINPSIYSCICPPGYVGTRCGTKDMCVEGHDGGLCENGACVYSSDGFERFCHCFRGTNWDEEMKECREPDPPCFPNPCMNGGTCSSEDNLWFCDCHSTGFQGKNCTVQDKCGDCERGTCVLDDKGTTKYCRCNKGLYWSEEKQTCEETVSPCDTSPCHNGGSCVATSDTEYNCTCGSGFSGDTCDVIEMCTTDEDCKHGTCVLQKDKKKRICHCDEGFYFEEWTHQCEEITACQPTPCWNDGTCTALSTTTYNCTCSDGWTGAKCEIRVPCKMDGGDAYCRNGLCSNNELGVYICTCKDGEYFQYTQRKCVELDLCPLVECSVTEECANGKCICRENYKWNNATQKCEPDFCSSHPCPLPEMICQEGTDSTDYKCSCEEGYSFNGTHCKEAVCTFPRLNPCNQICSPAENGYKCSCEEDFTLKDNHTCEYTGNQTCKNKTCDGGFCVQKNNMQICLCPPGFIEVEGKCIDVCSGGKLTAGICPQNECEEAKEGGFRCKCEGKFALSEDKSTCTVRNVCQQQELGWKTCTERNAECVEDWESSQGFKCQCAMGMVKTEGDVCQKICSLESNQRQCSIKESTCDVDGNGRMICKCPPYSKENERDGRCSQPADFSYLVTLPLDKSTYQIGHRRQRSLIPPTIDYWKISKDITIAMGEMFAEFRRAYVVSCKLASNGDSFLCKTELQFATERGMDLKRLSTEDVCLSNGNSNRCLIPPTLVLVKNRISSDVHIQPTDPCDEDITDFICGSEAICTSLLSHKSFNCSCKTGFFPRRKNYPFGNTRSIIEVCADIDECTVSDPCPPNSICTNTIGNYTCACKPGYRRVDAQKCIEVCNPNPCIHGTCSARGDNEFDCTCEAGYRGTFCNLQDGNFKRAKTDTIIVGVVLGGILLITLILFAVCISRIKKKKILESAGHMYYNSAEMTERRRVEGGAVNNAFQRE